MMYKMNKQVCRGGWKPSVRCNVVGPVYQYNFTENVTAKNPDVTVNIHSPTIPQHLFTEKYVLQSHNFPGSITYRIRFSW